MYRATKRPCHANSPTKEKNSTTEESLSTLENSSLSIRNTQLEELLTLAERERDELRTHNASLQEEARRYKEEANYWYCQLGETTEELNNLKGLFDCCIKQIARASEEIGTLKAQIAELEYQAFQEDISPLYNSPPSRTELSENNMQQQKLEIHPTAAAEDCKFRLKVLESIRKVETSPYI